MDRYNVDVIWRYAEGHRDTAVHVTTVKANSPESAERWGAEAVRRKFGAGNVEIVKATAQFVA